MAKEKKTTQCFLAGRQNGYFYVTPVFSKASSKATNKRGEPEPDSPARVYSKYSVLKACIVQVGGTSLSYNIKPDEMFEIGLNTEEANRLHIQELHGSSLSTEDPDIALVNNTKMFGKWAGYSVAQFVLEHKNDLDVVNQQYDFLKQNAAKYPKNRVQMEAISKAISLVESGRLDGDQISSRSKSQFMIPIYETPVKVNIYAPREDGMCPVSGMKITWMVGAETPVHIEISNYYAPVADNTTAVFSQRDKETEKKATFDLTKGEWLSCVGNCQRIMHMFEMLNCRVIFDDIVAVEKELAGRK